MTAELRESRERMADQNAELLNVLNEVRDTLRDLTAPALRAIAQTLYQLVPNSEDTADSSSKEPWRIENEERADIRVVSEKLSSDEFARFVGNRYRLPADDAWVKSLVKLRATVGLEAAITALRRHDQEN